MTYQRIERALWALLTASVFAFLTSIVVAAHEAPSGWQYPISCCSLNDCAPAKIGEKDGQMTLTNKFGTAIVPPNFNWRESGDEEYHACIICGHDETGSGGDPYCYLLCAFSPPGS